MRIEFRINLEVDKTTERILAGLTRLQDPQVMEQAIKTAMRKSILEGVRKRFAQQQATMALVSVIPSTASKALNTVKVHQQFRKLGKRIATAQKNNDVNKLNALHKEQATLVRKLTKRKQRLGRGRGAVLQALRSASNRRRSLMRNVRDVLGGEGPFGSESTKDSMTISVGAVPVLNSIKSPSATKLLSNRYSSTIYNHLWLQMEFGMGVFAKPTPILGGTRFKTQSGSWWYGPRLGRGIHFLGQKPGNLLRTQTGLPYTEDGRALTRMFAAQMNNILFGV